MASSSHDRDSSAVSKLGTVVGLGEALWDFLPAGRQVGGAPLNFAYISSLLGAQASIASRIGADALGAEMKSQLSARGIETKYLQRDHSLPTGSVKVTLSPDGQPKFEITQPVAWDALEFTPAWKELAGQADTVCFGTLAQRSEPSRNTITAFLQSTRSECVRIFDINLRSPFYSREVILNSIQMATILKFNEEELSKLKSIVGFSSPTAPRDFQALAKSLGVELICVTRGSHGSLLATPEQVVEHPGIPVQVVDAVGAGDAFTAAVAACWASGVSLETVSMVANQWASWVASQSGAMPVMDDVLRRKMLPQR